MGKLGTLILIWVFVLVAYILLGTMMPAYSEITSDVSTSIQASCNTSEHPGIVGAVESFPVYVWIIPGIVGMVSTVYVLKYSDAVNRWRGR